MNPFLKKIYENLIEIQKKAYAPYSNFYVASICKVNNHFFGGVNIENASYPVGNCAERSAICSAISSGYNKIDEIYILANVKNFITPCGLCRQFISEFMVDDYQKVVVFNNEGNYKIYLIKDLLLDRFKKEYLKNKV